MSMTWLLLLGGIVSLRDPASVIYRKVETTAAWVLAAVGICGYGAVAWCSLPQDEVNRLVLTLAPLLMALAVVARFGLQRHGLLGGGVFLALFASHVLFLVFPKGQPESSGPLVMASIVELVGCLGMLVFFYVVGKYAELARTPWPGGALAINRARCLSVGLLILGLAGCGYCFDNLWERGWLAQWSSAFVPLALVLSATAFAACLVGVAGLTMGRNPLGRRPEVPVERRPSQTQVASTLPAPASTAT
jgi:hypothetical protein